MVSKRRHIAIVFQKYPHSICSNLCDQGKITICCWTDAFISVWIRWSCINLLCHDMMGSRQFRSDSVRKTSLKRLVIFSCRYLNLNSTRIRWYSATISGAMGLCSGSRCLHCLCILNRWNLKLSAPCMFPRKWLHTSGIFQMSVFSSYPAISTSLKAASTRDHSCSGATKSPCSCRCPHLISCPLVRLTLGSASRSLATKHRSELTRNWLKVFSRSLESHMTLVPWGLLCKNWIILAYWIHKLNLTVSVLYVCSLVSRRRLSLSAVPQFVVLGDKHVVTVTDQLDHLKQKQFTKYYFFLEQRARCLTSNLTGETRQPPINITR